MPPYSAENYIDMDYDEYRKRFPDETKNLSDEQLYNVVAATDDDMDDDEWRKYFAHASATAMAG